LAFVKGKSIVRRMKRIALCILMATASLVTAADFEAPLKQGGIEQAPAEEAAPERPRLRIIDVLQMFNPFAPREYGGGDEALVDREDPERGGRRQQDGKARGFRLFSITIW